MSKEPTPRTDAERRKIKRTDTLDTECVGVEFCRTLERELNAVRKELEETRKALSDGDAARDRVRQDGDTNITAIRTERDQLRATNTELLTMLEKLENEAPAKGLDGFADQGQRIAYRFGWAHAIQEARAAI